MVVAPRTCLKGGQLCIAERADDREHAARGPRQQQHVRAPGGACHQRGCSEYARADDNADRDRDAIADTKGGTRLSGSCFACALQWFKSAHAVSARRMDYGDMIRAPLSTDQQQRYGGPAEQW